MCIVSDAQITAWTAPVGITGGANSSATVNTPEGSANGSLLFTATATPTGSGAAVTYRFTSDGNPDNVAAMNTTNGRATLVGTLDYEKTTSYIFKVL